jgi:hypothetical protein
MNCEGVIVSAVSCSREMRLRDGNAYLTEAELGGCNLTGIVN